MHSHGLKIVAIDPGEDLGWAIFTENKLVEAGTDRLWQFIDQLHSDLTSLSSNLEDFGPFAATDLILCEDWALYPWKLREMGWNKCRTARGIGAIEFIARVTGKELVLQPAAIKERAVAGGAEELFYRPLHENRHQNDAIMHGWYYIQTQLIPNERQHIEAPKVN